MRLLHLSSCQPRLMTASFRKIETVDYRLRRSMILPKRVHRRSVATVKLVSPFPHTWLILLFSGKKTGSMIL